MKNIKSPCEICDKLGERLRIDNIEGEHFPDEFKKLETVPDTDGDIRRCPLCGQVYAYDNRFDNDVYNLYDVSEIHRVSEDTVNSIIDSIKKRIEHEKKQVKRYWYKVRKFFGTRMEELSADEYRLMEYLKEKTINGAYISMIVKDLSISQDAVLEMVKKMEQAGFIVSRIYWPLGIGEHNFQEENRSVNPVEYTNIRINII